MPQLRQQRLALAALAACILLATAPEAAAADKIPITTSSRQALDQFLEGRTLVENLRLTDAIPRFKNASAKDSTFAIAYLYLAQTAPTAKDFFANLSRAVSLAQRTTPGEQLWIEGFKAGAYGDPEGQLAAYEKLVAMFPRDERAQALLGISYFVQQQYDKAADHLQQATVIAPDFAPAYNQLGYAYRFLNRFDDAERTFKRYTELIPRDPNPYDSYAELLLKMGRFPEAIAQYRRALSVDPQFANSLVGIAAALMYQGKHEEARTELAHALSGARTDGEVRVALFNTALTYLDEGKPDLALKEMDKEFAVAQKINDPANMSADLTAIGNILLDMGRADEALARFEKARELIRKSGLAPQVKENAEIVHHYNAGRVALAKKKYGEAEASANALMQGAESKKNINLQRLAHELAGSLALDRKHYETALAELQQANQQNPYNLYRMALARSAAGQKQEARSLCQAAARFNGLPQLNYALIRQKAERTLATL